MSDDKFGDALVAKLKESLSYNNETGHLTWTKTQRAGCTAGSITKKGYLRLEIGGVSVYVHRAVWAITYGQYPKDMIDHINGDKQDNRVENLRLVNNSINQQNVKKARSNSKTGVLGVVKWGKDMFAAHIWTQGGQKHLGKFKTIEEAQMRYLEAKSQLHAGYVS